jgi:hypothetical protein
VLSEVDRTSQLLRAPVGTTQEESVKKIVVIAVMVLGVAAAVFGATALAAGRIPSKTTAKTVQKGLKFTTTGTMTATSSAVVCPPGQVNAAYCTHPAQACGPTDLVLVRYKVGENTVSSRLAQLDKQCKYKSSVSFNDSRLGKYNGFHTKQGLALRRLVRFLGDSNVAPSSAPTKTFRAK